MFHVIVGAALMFGTLAQAGLAINARVPKEAMGVLEAVVILLVAAAAHVHSRRVAARGPAPQTVSEDASAGPAAPQDEEGDP